MWLAWLAEKQGRRSGRDTDWIAHVSGLYEVRFTHRRAFAGRGLQLHHRTGPAWHGTRGPLAGFFSTFLLTVSVSPGTLGRAALSVLGRRIFSSIAARKRLCQAGPTHFDKDEALLRPNRNRPAPIRGRASTYARTANRGVHFTLSLLPFVRATYRPLSPACASVSRPPSMLRIRHRIFISMSGHG